MIGKTIDYALQQPCVRGVTFQPIQDAGRIESWSQEHGGITKEMGAPFLAAFARNGDFDFDVPASSTEPGIPDRAYNPTTDRLTLTEVRRKILQQTTVFRPEDVVPVPCHPDSLAMAYALKVNGKVTPLTSMIPPAVLINGAANTILYEQEPAVRDGIFKLFATNHSPSSQAGTLRELLCCLPRVWLPEADLIGTNVSPVLAAQGAVGAPLSLSYNNIFRVIIMQFIDAHAFDVRSVKKTCVHIVHPDGRLIPFDTYNLFYRDDLEKTRLVPLRRQGEAAAEVGWSLKDRSQENGVFGNS